MAKNQQPRPAVRAGQVWEPKRGVRSLEVVNINGEFADVRKFDSRGGRDTTDRSRGGPRYTTVRIKSILSDYTLQRRS